MSGDAALYRRRALRALERPESAPDAIAWGLLALVDVLERSGPLTPAESAADLEAPEPCRRGTAGSDEIGGLCGCGHRLMIHGPQGCPSCIVLASVGAL